MIPLSSRDFYSFYHSEVWNIARDLNSGTKGMRIWAEFREHKHGKVFMRKYKNNYVVQSIQVICRDVITLQIVGAVTSKRESISSVVQRGADRAKERKPITFYIWAANTNIDYYTGTTRPGLLLCPSSTTCTHVDRKMCVDGVFYSHLRKGRGG